MKHWQAQLFLAINNNTYVLPHFNVFDEFIHVERETNPSVETRPLFNNVSHVFQMSYIYYIVENPFFVLLRH